MGMIRSTETGDSLFGLQEHFLYSKTLVAATPIWSDWLTFVGGITLGASIELSINVSD